MNNHNTTKQGDIFEKKVYDVIYGLLINNEFYINKKNSIIYCKRRYYSESRKDHITFDISIETFIPNSKNFSLLTIIECKNYGKAGVPVDDIEEFDSKLNQVGEHNTKGIIVTNSHFQKGAINLAKSKKIALIRINDRNEIDWINYRKEKTITNTLVSIDSLLSSDKFSSNFIGLYNKNIFSELPSLLVELGVIDKYVNRLQYINIPFKTENEIEKIILELEWHEFYSYSKLDISKLCKYLNNKYNLTFNFDTVLGYSQTNKILGHIRFKPLEISISKELFVDINRWRFTLAHEIGHLILHYDYLIEYFEENSDNEATLDFNIQNKFSLDNKRLEIQANIFASRLLMPQDKFYHYVMDYFQKERIYKGYLYLDNQKCNINLTMKLLLRLQEIFGVSKETIKIRLLSQGLLNDVTDTSLQSMLIRR